MDGWMDGWMDGEEELEAKEESLAPAWDVLSFSYSLYTAMARRPREQRQSPIFSLPWVPAPLPLSDEESGPKVLLTLEGEESLEEGEGKAAQRSQRRRRRPRLQSCRAGSLGFCVRATGAPLGQRTAHPFRAGRLGPCGRQTGSPGSHRDPRAQWRGRQQDRQHCRDHPQPQRSKCPRPGGYAIISPHPATSAWHFPSAQPPRQTAFLPLAPALFPYPAVFSASPSSCHPSTPPLPPPAGRDPWRCGAHAAAAG